MSRTVEDILGAFQGDRRERGGFWPGWQSIGNRPETDTGDIKAFVRGLQWIGRGHTPVCMRGNCVCLWSLWPQSHFRHPQLRAETGLRAWPRLAFDTEAGEHPESQGPAESV